MLDKSVPYFDVYMHRKKGASTPIYNLPAGYKFSLFQSGDELEWAKIETSVLEFSNELDALIYFQKKYLPFISMLEKRCLFIESDKGEKIATSMAWWCCPNCCDPWLHWVSVKPQYQKLGLGKAIIFKIIQIMLELEGDKDFYLHTQTWSHRAIKIYEKFGFTITNQSKLCNYANENYKQAIAVLECIANEN